MFWPFPILYSHPFFCVQEQLFYIPILSWGLVFELTTFDFWQNMYVLACFLVFFLFELVRIKESLIVFIKKNYSWYIVPSKLVFKSYILIGLNVSWKLSNEQTKDKRNPNSRTSTKFYLSFVFVLIYHKWRASATTESSWKKGTRISTQHSNWKEGHKLIFLDKSDSL